eukprot:10161287-Ditylum_brightwellii.AAC.2
MAFLWVRALPREMYSTNTGMAYLLNVAIFMPSILEGSKANFMHLLLLFKEAERALGVGRDLVDAASAIYQAEM